MEGENRNDGAASQQGVVEHGPLVDDVEDLLTPNCLALLYNVKVASQTDALSMHAVSWERESWKCVRARMEDTIVMRPGHMPQGSTAGKKLLAMRKITVTETAPGWELRQYYVADVLLVELGESWETIVGFLKPLFLNEMGLDLRAPLGCWCAWPADRVVLEGNRVALHKEDLVPDESPLKDQSGLYSRQSARHSGYKRILASLEGRKLQFGGSPKKSDSRPGPSSGQASEAPGAQESKLRATANLTTTELKVWPDE